MDDYEHVETNDFLKPYFDFKELIKEINSMKVVDVRDEFLMKNLIEKLDKVADLWIDLYNSNYAFHSELFFQEALLKSYQQFIEYLSDLKSNEGRNFRNTELLV